MDLKPGEFIPILFALNQAGFGFNIPYLKRTIRLMRYHKRKHKIELTPDQAVELLKLELVEFVIRTKPRGFVDVKFEVFEN